MTFHGHMENGVAILDSPAGLPDGTPVRIEVERIDSQFWRSKTLDELTHEQAVRPCADPADLAGVWPENESVDEFISLIRRSRV